ncbi:MAG TPA: serine/threonine-protein kinase [Acidobacteriota bacterium]|nr:serine/threonine-protein kinase [Acidobacteriota bacterium]
MIGQKLGPYTILEIVGSGGIGAVYKAEDPEGRLVAVKLVRAKVLNTRDERERFLRSALIASEIRRSSVCPILEIGDDNNDLFVITPFLQGKTLDQYMGKKPLPWPRAIEIALATGAAISDVHEANAVHGAIRPTNIWILDSGPANVVLTDCCMEEPLKACQHRGIGGPHDGPCATDSPVHLERLLYMSPEQLRGEPMDHRTDIFSFGIIFYEMISGRYPFEAQDAPACIGRILKTEPSPIDALQAPFPMQIQAILDRALARDRADRYPDMRTLLSDIGSASSQREPARNPSALGKWLASKILRPLRQ